MAKTAVRLEIDFFLLYLESRHMFNLQIIYDTVHSSLSGISQKEECAKKEII